MKTPTFPNFKGPKGETIFSRLIRVTPENFKSEVYDRAKKNIDHIASFKDERILAIHGAILVEKTIDLLIVELFISMKKIERKRFATKINLLKSLQIIPIRLLDTAGLIKNIRNDFAHDLNLKTLKNLPGKMQTAQNFLSEFYKNFPRNDDIFDEYKALIMTSSMGFEFYRRNLRLLNKYLRSGNFEDRLETIS